MAKVDDESPTRCHCGRQVGKWGGIWPRRKGTVNRHCDRCRILGCSNTIKRTGKPPKSCSGEPK